MAEPKPSVIRDLGDELPADTARRAWIEQQSKNNADRLESTAQTFLQLVTALYGVLFAVLALGAADPYLADMRIQWLAIASMLGLGVALIASLVVVYPFSSTYQKNNLTEIEEVYNAIHTRKATSLGIATLAFGAGIAALALLIVIIVAGV